MKLIRTTTSRPGFRGRWLAGAITALVLGTAAAACGSSGHSATSAQSVKANANVSAGSKTLKIAYLTGGSTTTFLTTENSAVLDTARAAGASIQMFDPAFDPTTQYDEMANVISGGKFNSIILTPISAQVMCPLVKKAIAKGIEVVTGIDPVCGLSYANGAATWYPGTLEAVSAQTPIWWDAYFDFIAKANPSGGEAAIFTGPSILPLTVNTNNAAKKVFAGTKLTVVSTSAGDYTSATAFTMAADVFKAHPHVRVVVSNYSGMTQGIIAAAKQAGILKSLRIYDVGGSKQALQLIASGTLAMSSPLVPATFGKLAAQALIEHADGKTVAHYIDPIYPLRFITKSNWQQFEAESY
jgi:ribose transport system substrate-binding protein